MNVVSVLAKKYKVVALIKNESNEKVVKDIDALSSGTMATMSGIKNYQSLDRLQTAFGNFVYSSSSSFDTWAHAWKAWMDKLSVRVNSNTYNVLVAQDLEDALEGII